MKHHHTALRAATAALVAGALPLLAVPAALAAPTGDHSEAVKVAWDGGGDYASSIAGSFVGSPVAVPGDTAERTLTVLNDGPTSGTMRVSIINVELADPEALDIHHNPGHAAPGQDYAGAGDQGRFYDDLRLTETSFGPVDASFTELYDRGVTVVGQKQVDQGEVVDVTVGYELPWEATSGNKANVADRQASFDVLVEISGDLPDEPDIPDTPSDPDPPETSAPGPSGQGPDSGATPSHDTDAQHSADATDLPDSLPRTGAEIAALIVAAGLLISGGVALYRLTRKKEGAQ